MEIKDYLYNKNILITGGTGSIGKELLDRIIKYEPKNITVFSRNESNQHRLGLKYPNNKNLRFVIGDIRDLESIKEYSKKADILFHCAALKHVPISERNPEEFIKTNILGALNIKKAAVENRIKIVVSISTDKVVNPTNVMGMTKAIQEKIFSTEHMVNPGNNTKFVNVRFGNVVGTAGSLFPIVYYQIKNNKPVTLTHPDMTRFFMTKEDAIDLILDAMILSENGDTFVRTMKSVNVRRLIKMFLMVCGKRKDYLVKNIGIRVGEKIHESLVTEDEYYRCNDLGKYVVIKPYLSEELQENLIKKNTKEKPMLEKYASNYKGNFFTDDELEQLIKKFICESDETSPFL